MLAAHLSASLATSSVLTACFDGEHLDINRFLRSTSLIKKLHFHKEAFLLTGFFPIPFDFQSSALRLRNPLKSVFGSGSAAVLRWNWFCRRPERAFVAYSQSGLFVASVASAAASCSAYFLIILIFFDLIISL